MATEGKGSLTRLPAGTPAALRRHPALLVEWLQLLNLLSRWRGEVGRTAVLAGSFGIVAGVSLAMLSAHASGLIERLARYWLLVGAVSAIDGWTIVSGRRRRMEESQSQSWLIATPIPAASLRLSIAIRTLLPVVALFVGVGACLVIGLLFGDAAVSDLARVVAALSAGVLIGCSGGWLSAGRGSKSGGSVASRYVPAPRVRTSDRFEAQAAGLARWPIAQVLSWSRPENSRYVLILALLAVQGGSSALAGLSVVAMYFIASYLGALLSAMTTVAKSAATWLRSTPMSLADFVWSLCRRAFLHQLAGTALAVIFMSLLGSPLAMTFQIAALWLGLVISVSGVALVDHYRGRSPAVKIAISVATLIALAATLQLRTGAKA